MVVPVRRLSRPRSFVALALAAAVAWVMGACAKTPASRPSEPRPAPSPDHGFVTNRMVSRARRPTAATTRAKRPARWVMLGDTLAEVGIAVDKLRVAPTAAVGRLRFYRHQSFPRQLSSQPRPAVAAPPAAESRRKCAPRPHKRRWQSAHPHVARSGHGGAGAEKESHESKGADEAFHGTCERTARVGGAEIGRGPRARKRRFRARTVMRARVLLRAELAALGRR